MWFDLRAQTVLDLLYLKKPNSQNYKTLGLDSFQTIKLAQCNIQFTSLASNDFCFVVLFLLLFAFIYLFVYLFIRLLNLLISLFTYLFICLFIYFIYLFIYLFIQSFIYLFLYIYFRRCLFFKIYTLEPK